LDLNVVEYLITFCVDAGAWMVSNQFCIVWVV